MPAPRTTKTYLASTTPTAPIQAPVPFNSQRIALLVQNTGAKPGNLRLGPPPQGNGSDIMLAAGAFIKWDQADTCPQEAVNVACVAQADSTTWAIMETIVPR